MNDDLDTKTDAQISEIFAVEVAGWEKEMADVISNVFIWVDADGAKIDIDGNLLYPVFATSADAVMLWLEKSGAWASGYLPSQAQNKYTVCVGTPGFDGCAATFARAACIALIRAKRAEKGDAK